MCPRIVVEKAEEEAHKPAPIPATAAKAPADPPRAENGTPEHETAEAEPDRTALYLKGPTAFTA